MTLALVRVDCRLVHGQVLEAWVPYVRSDCILVADDAVANNVLQKTIMSMSIPRHILFEVDTVQSLVRRLMTRSWENRRVLLLFSDCAGAHQAYLQGLQFKLLNVGNLHYEDGRHRITPSIALSRDDFFLLKELNDTGVPVEFRAIPHDRPVPLDAVTCFA